MNCDEEILKSLNVLDQEFRSVQEFLSLDKECVELLIRLDMSCSDELADAGINLLEYADNEQNEYKLQAVLRALLTRQQPETLELIAKALESKDTTDNETYLNYLQEIRDLRAVPVLMKFIDENCNAPEESALEVATAIDILTRYKAQQAESLVLPLINHESSLVRTAVLEFLRSLNLEHVIASIERRMFCERDLAVFVILLEIFVMWSDSTGLSVLQKLLSRSHVHNTDEFVNLVNEAMVHLLAKEA